MAQSRSPVAAFLRSGILAGLVLVALSACTGRAPSQAPAGSTASGVSGKSAAVSPAVVLETPGAAPATPAGKVENSVTVPGGVQPLGNEKTEVIAYASDLPESALYELEIWRDPASPGGKMIGLPNTGDELDPPPENDPHATFEVSVLAGIPYRCWIHMKVGAPKGKSQANVIWVQFPGAIDKNNNPIFRPGTNSYLTAQGPTAEGWSWVGCNRDDKTDPLIYFDAGGAAMVRLQAGMEGVGFDQFVLSPARFLESPPAEAVIEK